MKKLILTLLTFNFLVSCDGLLGPFTDGAEIDPKKISGLVLWLKADAGVKNTMGGNAIHGDSVNSWEDQSGNNYNAGLGTAPFYYQNSVFNNSPALYFSPGNSLSGPGGMSISINATIITVTYTTFSTAQSFINFLGGSNNPTHRLDASFFYTFDLGGTNAITPYGYGNKVIFYSAYDNNYITTYINGKSMNKIYTPGLFNAIAPIDYDIGGAGSDFYIAEILIYNRNLSNTEHKEIESYLGKKYDIEYEGD